MDVKGFKDGEDFVLTFNGIGQDVIDKLIKTFKPELLSPVNAKPLIVDEAPAMEDGDIPASEQRMIAGPLKGLTVAEALSQKGDVAFKILSFFVREQKLHGENLEEAKARLNDYVVWRFKDHTDPQTEAGAMTPDQLNEFVGTFFPLISPQIWELVKGSPEKAGALTESQKRAIVYLVIKKYNKMALKNE